MAAPSSRDITQLLLAWSQGDESALDQLMPLVYDELRRKARAYMAHQPPGHMLQTTALVNEVYLRLVNFQEVGWQDRAHFFAICAKVMRRILVDFARSKSTVKRGGTLQRVALQDALAVTRQAPDELLAIDGALESLAACDARKGQVVELRFFGGLSVEETGEVLKVSEETVKRDWRLAKLWLLREIRGENRCEA
jgi:RNA polymerase sigma factor (TIGR02999 family)